MHWWIWLLIGLIAAVICIIALRKRKRQLQPLSEDERYGRMRGYKLLRLIELAGTDEELSTFFEQQRRFLYELETIEDELKERASAALSKIHDGRYRHRAHLLREKYGDPSHELEASVRYDFYRELLTEPEEVATILHLTQKEARQYVSDHMTRRYNELCTSLATGERDAFNALNMFLTRAPHETKHYRLTLFFNKPEIWDQWLAFHFPNPNYDDFRHGIQSAPNEAALQAAEALRTRDIVLAKLVMAYVGTRKNAIGEVLYADVVKLVEAHNARSARQRLQELGLTVAH